MSRKSIIFLIVGLTLMTSAEQSRADCTKCIVRQTGEARFCYFCTAAGAGETGGKLCSNPDCSTCTIHMPCVGGGSLPPTGDRASDLAQPVLSAPITFDAETIREVAAQHPRFAFALAMLNRRGGLVTDHVHMFMAPVEVSAEDVAAILNPEDPGAQAVIARFDARVQKVLKRMARGKQQPVEYEFTAGDVAGQKTVKLQVVKAAGKDGAYRSLELNLSPDGEARTLTMGWKISL